MADQHEEDGGTDAAALVYLLFIISFASSVVVALFAVAFFFIFSFTSRIAQDLPQPTPFEVNTGGDIDVPSVYK